MDTLTKGKNTMQAYICDYADFMKNTCHKSTNTVESYTRDIAQYISYLSDLGISSISNTSKTTVLSYMAVLKSRGRAASTMSRTLASIRSFYLFLVSIGKIKSDPTSTLSTPRVEKKPPMVLSGEDINRLLAQPSLTDNKGIRDKAMLELLYATGIRVSELIGLDLEDVNIGMGCIRCRNSRSERVIPIGVKAVEAMQLYLDKARGYMVKSNDETALFVNCNGSRISRQGFWKIIKQYRTSSGIEMEITPHALRHSFAAHLIENGADLDSLKTMMGHADISSTQIYTAFVNDKLREVYNKTHPRAV